MSIYWSLLYLSLCSKQNGRYSPCCHLLQMYPHLHISEPQMRTQQMNRTTGDLALGSLPFWKRVNGRHIHFFKTFAIWSPSWKECLAAITVDKDLRAAVPSTLSLLGKQRVRPTWEQDIAAQGLLYITVRSWLLPSCFALWLHCWEQELLKHSTCQPGGTEGTCPGSQDLFSTLEWTTGFEPQLTST